MERVLYNHYFEIDPEYFPVVDENVIREKPDLWKKYYPHRTFVELLKDVIKVLCQTGNLKLFFRKEPLGVGQEKHLAAGIPDGRKSLGHAIVPLQFIPGLIP